MPAPPAASACPGPDQDPFDEDAHLGLVRALLRAGRHGEARRRYGIYAARMSELQLEAASFPTPAAAGA